MSLRLLLIDDQADYRALVRHHVTTEWADATLRDWDPALEGRPIPEFTAAAYDAVLLDHDLAGQSGLEWLKDFTQRPGFPPVIFLSPSDEDAEVLPALRGGAEACIGKRKIDHRRLISTLREASRKRKRQLALWRGTSQVRKLYEFGQITIRGQRFIRQIATGPVSTVYLAESERAGELVVLKVLRSVPELADRKGTFDRFLQEYEVVSKVEHPNIVRIHDLGVADDHAYIAMEYFAEGDLRARLKQPMTPGLALRYLRQMAAALQAIHAVGVLHRDLKPGNVMLRPDGTLALIDFGLAKVLKFDAAITAAGEIFGTPYYMSPEQGHGQETDERSDLYSIGVIFFEMLAGRKPYLAPTPMAVIYKQRHAPLPDLPEPLAYLQPLAHRLLAKDPRERFQTAEAVIEAIDGMAAAVPA
jgi:DNA-binding response OmpR family regulator/tRNA A-37 threonylcarbamoyl transferase component Bud32